MKNCFLPAPPQTNKSWGDLKKGEKLLVVGQFNCFGGQVNVKNETGLRGKHK